MVFSFLGGQKDNKPAPTLRGPAQVRAYWEGLRRNGAIPSRPDLDPRGMGDVLDQVFVGERIGTGLVRLRIAGMAIADLAGLDMKGMPLSALFVPEARLRLAEVLERVLTRPEATELHLEAERGIGRPALQARLLLLPLRSAAGGRDLVLGCLATDGDLGRAPRRFAIARVVAERLEVPQATMPPQMPTVLPPDLAPTPAFAVSAAQAPAPQSQRPIAGRPYLRLVHSAS
jgi:hypothetical protein